MTENTGPFAEEIRDQNWSVPTFEQIILSEKKEKYAIIIPVINEGDRIQRQLKDMHSAGSHSLADVVVVDGGSTDGSLETSFLKSVNVRALITKTGSGKLSAQLRCAYAWALLEGYQGIVTIDGNGKDGIEAIPEFVKALNENIGYAQASRFAKGGYSENTPLSRLLAVRLIHSPLQSLAAGVWLTDTTQGFRAYSRDYLLDQGTQPFRDIFDKYELLAYLTARASQLGYKVREIATSRVYPEDEAIPTKISGVGALLDLILVVVGVLFKTYHPTQLPLSTKNNTTPLK